MKTKCTLTVFCFLLSAFAYTFSQAPTLQLDADFGGSENEQFAAMIQTKDGGYLVGGYSESGISGDKTQASQGSSDYWIVKTNASGVKEWDFRYGGTSVDQLTCLRQTSDGGYILGGISFSGIGGDKTKASRGNSDYWIVKINAKGKKQWDAAFGGTGPDELHSIEQTADGGYILGGSSLSNISGDKTQNTKGGKDFWIVKTDSNGAMQWDADFGGNLFEELFSIQQSKDGGYIMGGYSLSGVNGDKTDPNRGRYDFWVVKANADGVKQWDAGYGGKDDDWLSQIRQTTDGGYILGGWSWSGGTGDKSQPTKGANDYWIIKIDKNGVRQWDADFGGSSNDYLNPIEQTTDGGYILGGYSSSPADGDKTQASQGGVDYWIVKINAKGKKQWDATFGGSDFDFMYDLKQTSDGGYVLGGYSSSNISGDKTQDSKGLNDYWIVKTTADSSVCNIRGNLKTNNITATDATLRWKAVSGAASYAVQYRIAHSLADFTNINTSTNNVRVHDLFAETPYEWRVRSVCNQQPLSISEWSDKTFFTTGFEEGITAKSNAIRNNFKVYPNPVTNILYVENINNSIQHIQIINALGTTVVSKKINKNEKLVNINLQNVPQGNYYIRVMDAEGNISSAVINKK